MKPQLLKVSSGLSQSFSVRQDHVPYFYNRWHYHPEVELICIEKGEGMQFVGDSITKFQPGDVLLIGPDLPHYWRCDDIYFQDETLTAKATVIHFKMDFWGEQFLRLPENSQINELLQKSSRGIKLNKTLGDEVSELMKKMLKLTDAEKVIYLLIILNKISKSSQPFFLSSPGFAPLHDEKDDERINDIYAYSLNHFKEKISLEDISAVANITPHSFCRYFKSRTKKNFSRFLQEIRIGYACKLLIENRLTITQICYESGFNNFVNFYRSFKIITDKTPHLYKKEYLASSLS